MADVNKFSDMLLQFEGGYVNNKSDLGGCTNEGITLATWQKFGWDMNGDNIINCDDIKLLGKKEFVFILKKYYWDVLHCDDIQNQSIANFICDWFYNSGYYAIKHLQTILKLTADGIIGPNTIKAINSANQEQLFKDLQNDRITFVNNICKTTPSQNQFLVGWLRRINSFKF
jgi:hypothetical protein